MRQVALQKLKRVLRKRKRGGKSKRTAAVNNNSGIIIEDAAYKGAKLLAAQLNIPSNKLLAMLANDFKY